MSDPYTVWLDIEAADLGPHMAGRAGDALDSDPATLAVVNASDPVFGWINYAPGPDKNHSLTISESTWKLEVTPHILILGPRTAYSAAALLEIRERHPDCQEEPYWGHTRCPVTWSLDLKVTVLASGRRVAPDTVGMSVSLEEQRGAGATVTVSNPGGEEERLEKLRRAGSYQPGDYRIDVTYAVGHPPNASGVTASIDVTLI